MSKADRANLERLARKRARVAKAMIGERVKVLRADVEDQLAAGHKVDDELWADVARHAQAEVENADAEIARVCRRLGIPDDLRPSLSVGWRGRGENALAGRRTELRKLAHARIDAAADSAKVAIESNLLDVETGLIREGLDSATAAAYLDAMPTPDELLPPVDVGQLDAGDGDDRRPSRWAAWEPPAGTTGHLLSPSTASTREAKRRAVAGALAAHPDASDREVGRLAGVDHKTVGRLRAVGGELPGDGGEVPTADVGDPR